MAYPKSELCSYLQSHKIGSSDNTCFHILGRIRMYIAIHSVAMNAHVLLIHSESTINILPYTYIGYTSHDASSGATTGAAVGGVVVGILLLIFLIALCILLRMKINSRKKRKIKYLTANNVHFTKASSNSGHYIPESLNMKFTDVTSEVNERIGK